MIFRGRGRSCFFPQKTQARKSGMAYECLRAIPESKRARGLRTCGSSPQMRATIERLAKVYPNLYTILPYEKELGGFPHEKETVDWLKLAAPQATLKDIHENITALRLVKSPTEIMLLRQAIGLSLDAHFAAMKMMRPGLWEYQVAAKMVEVH